jgi:hypothetical protein
MQAAMVVGGSPVSFVAPSGKQYGIPLSLLAIKQGAVDTSRLDPAIAAAALPTLSLLYANGVLVASAASAPVAALVLTAKATGAIGNEIEVDFADVKPNATSAGDTTVDATLRASDRRSGLTPVSAGAELGKPGGATKPGLVTLTAAATKLPGALPATALAAAAPGDPLTLAVAANDGSGVAFTLQAVAGVGPPATLTAAIEDVDTTAGTFTLALALNHAVADVALKNLGTNFGLLLDVAPGLGGYAPPVVGTAALSGGADAQTSAPIAAKVTVLSS